MPLSAYGHMVITPPRYHNSWLYIRTFAIYMYFAFSHATRPTEPVPFMCFVYNGWSRRFLSHQGWCRFSTNCDHHAMLLSSILYPIIDDAPTGYAQLWFDRRQNRSPIPTLSYCSMITTTSLFQHCHLAINKCIFCILSIRKSESNISHREM